MGQDALELGAGGEGFETKDGDLVIGSDLVVVGLVEGQGQHYLLLQVDLVDSKKTIVKKKQNLNFNLYLANDLTTMALPPRNLGSKAACSREEPSPKFLSPKTTQLPDQQVVGNNLQVA